MKRFKLLLVALATVSFTAFYACGGEQKTDEGSQTEEVQETPAQEQTEANNATGEVTDSSATGQDSTQAETPTEEQTGGGE